MFKNCLSSFPKAVKLLQFSMPLKSPNTCESQHILPQKTLEIGIGYSCYSLKIFTWNSFVTCVERLEPQKPCLPKNPISPSKMAILRTRSNTPAIHVLSPFHWRLQGFLGAFISSRHPKSISKSPLLRFFFSQTH